MRLPRLVLALLLFSACGGDDQPAKPKGGDTPKRAPADAAPPPAPAPDAAPPADPDPKGEFDEQAKQLYRVAACGGDEPLPANIPAKVVEAHCKALDKIIAEYREKWVDKALPFLASIVPKDLPDHVLYPFGGSDLATALATFPDVAELTVISLETAGDVRRIDKVRDDELVDSLKENREHLQFLYRSAFHKTVDLKAMTESGLPGHLVGAMVALKIFGYAPVTLRYFVVKDDGSLEYVTNKFENVEITFRKPGGKLQVYRHIAANLENGHLKKNPGLVTYITSRAPFTAMTKASSFLMWEDHFSTIRNLLLDNMVWMISDATAPLPEHSLAKGFELIPYGEFSGPEPAFSGLEKADVLVKLWKDSEKRECPIRYGYSDAKRRAHLLITRKKVEGGK